jgi:hypothetical protein
MAVADEGRHDSPEITRPRSQLNRRRRVIAPDQDGVGEAGLARGAPSAKHGTWRRCSFVSAACSRSFSLTCTATNFSALRYFDAGSTERGRETWKSYRCLGRGWAIARRSSEVSSWYHLQPDRRDWPSCRRRALRLTARGALGSSSSAR